MIRLVLVIAFLLWLKSGALAQCMADWNGDGSTTIDEVVLVVQDALHGCSSKTAAPLLVSATTDKSRYQTGDTAILTMRLVSQNSTLWWSGFPVKGPLKTCLLNVRITGGHFSEERLFYERLQDRDDVYRACLIYDGGPRRVRDVLAVPPAFEITAEVPLVEKLFDVDEAPLEPGIYYMEGRLDLGLVPEGTDPFVAPNSPRLKAGVHIEIYEQ